MIDRFGKEVSIEKVDENNFAVRVYVAVSPIYLAWMFQFGNNIKILSPETVVERYNENLWEIINSY